MQSDEYYPFGLEANKAINGTKNKYLYNRKELQEELGMYDYGARFYDPVVGRWTVVDPLVEVGQESGSPYGYVFDDPVKNTDPDGRAGDDDPPTAVSVTWNAIKGVGQSVLGTVTGIAQVISHPVETSLAIQKYSIPGGVGMNLLGDDVAKSVKGSAQQFQKGNANVKANMIGNWAGDIAQFFVGAEEVKAAASMLKGVKTTEEVGKVAKVATTVEKEANTVEHVSPYELEPTHNITKSKSQMQKLKADVKENGVKEPIDYVEHNGTKYVVNGHHRLRVAKELGHSTVPVQKVQLPHLGYKTVEDLFYTHY